MARTMSAETTKIYRVVVVLTNGFKLVYGPYELVRTAGFVKSYMTSGWYSNRTKDSYIEVCEPDWERYD